MNCFLIIAHKNPRQIVRLAKAVHTAQTDVIIHVDRYICEQDYSEIAQSLESGIYLTDRRYHGSLDDRSLVDIALELIKKGKEIEKAEHKHYNYYALLSGQDYPIKPMNFIETELIKAYPKPFIDCTPYSKDNWLFYKFDESKKSLIYHKWYRKLPNRYIRAPFVIAERVVHSLKLINTSKEKLDKLQVGLYGGSAWWILPDTIINYVLSELEKTYIHILLDECLTPEETFFQILAMRSPVSERVHVNPYNQESQSCKTFAYFSDVGKPFKGHPYTITSDMVDRLVKSDFWIARKFDINEDASVFDLLDEAVGRISDRK